VVLDESGGDGAAGEGDDVRGDVENVSTGAGNDVVIGSGAANRLVTGGGDDRVEGGAGDDELTGGNGANVLVGGPGRDTLSASEFQASGVVLRDRIEARDGEIDRILCAGGSDSLAADPNDRAYYCAPVAVRAWRGYVRVSRRGTVRLRVRCPATAEVACAGRLSLSESALFGRVGVGEFERVAAGRTGMVTVRLKSALRRRLATMGRLSTEVTVIARRERPASEGEGFHLLRLLRPR
jgi:Ca2+-binding RTX toxin-like protein